LVEALVALSLFALLTVLLFGGLRFGNRAVALGGSKMERAAAIALAEGFVRAQISRAEPLAIAGADRQAVIAFDGEADHRDFVSLPPAYLSVGGFQWFRIAIDGVEPHRRLIAQWQPIQPNGGAPEMFSGSASVLLDGVASATFSYFSVGDSDHSAAWHDRWKDPPALPDLISLRIVFVDGEIAPDLLVAPRLAGTTATAR
jgi:general secretion pathway protein J